MGHFSAFLSHVPHENANHCITEEKYYMEEIKVSSKKIRSRPVDEGQR